MPDNVSDSAYSTRPLTAETWDDFAKLVEANNGIWGRLLVYGISS
jgi:hypothetical protein